MKYVYPQRLVMMLLALLVLPFTAQGEQFKDFGQYVVHYNTIKTDFLSAEVAREYDITRSRNRAMLNVSVLKKADDGKTKPIEAEVDATATNLTGQLKNIDMRAIFDRGAIYYIGELSVEDEEVLDFKVNITPDGTGRTLTITFREQFFRR